MITDIENVTHGGHKLTELFSRVNDSGFSTIDYKTITGLIEGLNEVNRATKSFGKKDSQTFSKLTSLTMVASSPYGRLKQCLAIIEKKRSALRDNIFILRKQRNRIKKLNVNICEEPEGRFQDINIESFSLEIEEIQCSIADSTLYIEGAVKELASYQDAYVQIKTSHHIPDAWSESHYEQNEVEEHIRLAFQHAVRDKMMTGRINVGTQEYLEQFGVLPSVADHYVTEYLNEIQKNITKADIDTLYTFLDKVAVKFKDEYKKCIKQIGLDALVTQPLLYNGKG